jgi:cytochrome c oxidase subunit II
MVNKILMALVALAILVAACAPAQEAQQTPPTMDDPQIPTTDEPDEPSGIGVVLTGSVTAGVREVHVESYNFGFEPTTITVKEGERVRLVATSREGGHGIGIPAFGVNTGEFKAGETKTVEFVADKAGEYPFFCNVFCGSGHRSMKGTLIVTT